MKRFLVTFSLAALVVLVSFLTAVSVSAQKAGVIDVDGDHVYPSRENNYCLSDLAVASASSAYPNWNFAASGAIDGDRIGQAWGNGGGWNDGTRDAYPDWLRVDFGRAHSISRVVVVTFQDEFNIPRIEPYLGLQVGNNYTIENYTIEVLTASGWMQVASEEENIDIIREYKFAPVTGTAIRVTITEAYALFSRVIEFEAYAV